MGRLPTDSLVSCVCGVGAVVLSIVAVPDAVAAEKDAWFTLTLAGARCGWMHESTRASEGSVETINETHMTLGRAGAQATVALSWRFVESPPGTAKSCEVTSDAGGEASRVTYRFEDTDLVVVQRVGGRDSERREKLPAQRWLTPSQVETLTQHSRTAQVLEFEYTTLDPSGGMRAISMLCTPVSRSDQGSTWKAQNRTLNLTSMEQVDAEGELLSSRTALGIGELVAQRATKEEALKRITGPSLDVITQSIVVLDAPHPALATASRAVLRVTGPETGLLLPSAGAQAVKAGASARDAEVTVSVGGSTKATVDELRDPSFLASTLMIDASDARVKELSARAIETAGLSATSTHGQMAEALRAFVASYIHRKGLATAYASASAVARSRSGDCSEHAMLLAALLRARGIPSRVAGGLVYADEFAGKKSVFAWHMWTQGLIDGEWVDFDATLRDRSFHPGHLLIATSAQDEPSIDADFSTMLSTIGMIKIEVLRVD